MQNCKGLRHFKQVQVMPKTIQVTPKRVSQAIKKTIFDISVDFLCRTYKINAKFVKRGHMR